MRKRDLYFKKSKGFNNLTSVQHSAHYSTTHASTSTLFIAIGVFLFATFSVLPPVYAQTIEPFSTAQRNTCSPNQTIPWPLPMLTKEEREARIKIFLAPPFKFTADNVPENNSAFCSSLMAKLVAFKDVLILEPTYVSADINAEEAARIIPQCPEADLESEYRTEITTKVGDRLNIFTRDAVFIRKNRGEKESASKDYIRATANGEYYNLSHFLGDGIWGFFAEGARYFKKNTQSRLPINDGPWAGAIQKIFDAKTCLSSIDPYRSISRVGLRTKSDAFIYYPNASFFAFLEIEGNLYRLTLQSSLALSQVSELLRPRQQNIRLYLDSTEWKDERLSIREVCSFSSTP